jgi:septal ring factor EnvC (AmiA/AmiB activator)
VVRVDSRSEGEPVVELRVVGPGRVERDHRRRIAELEIEVQAADRRSEALETALDLAYKDLESAQLLERGSQRLCDRLEAELDRARAERDDLRQSERRLSALVGALQRENELLQERLSPPQLPAARRSLLARLFRRGPRR